MSKALCVIGSFGTFHIVRISYLNVILFSVRDFLFLIISPPSFLSLPPCCLGCYDLPSIFYLWVFSVLFFCFRTAFASLFSLFLFAVLNLRLFGFSGIHPRCFVLLLHRCDLFYLIIMVHCFWGGGEGGVKVAYYPFPLPFQIVG